MATPDLVAGLPGWLDPLQQALADPERVGALPRRQQPAQARRAGVLILFGDGARGPELVFLERAAQLRSHPGQIAFPGGEWEAEDADLTATAVRETKEEVGVPGDEVVTFGVLPATQVAVSGFDVTATLGWWTRSRALAPVDLTEVAAVHQVPITELADPDRRVQVRHPSGYTGPAFEIGDITIWGLTAHFTDAVLSLGGWERPWDRSRLVPIPPRHLRDHLGDRQRGDSRG